MADDRGELRFIASAREESAVHDHHPVREHRRIEVGASHWEDADLCRLIAEQPLHDSFRDSFSAGSVIRRFEAASVSSS